MRELVYYVAVSLDGYIAGPDGQFDAFAVTGDHMDVLNDRFADAIPTDAARALGIAQASDEFDTVVMGWNTYAVGLEHGVTSPYRHLRQVVFSRTHEADGPDLTVTDADPVEVVQRLKSEPGSSIWLCGGGMLAAQLVDEVDRLVLKRHPRLFGDGIPLFGRTAYSPAPFKEIDTRAFGSGVVVSEYVRGD